ncbi:glycoside hydrolase family 3 N-terminal domain-containing protein [Argonema galeatum]|uniref:glycoside hydrolase family 3 N-terminal domain-containing protein n=1 Tax=Argonema galeatum TaxID=2942762 RepID=UPI002012967C|nr:glycoside hydrolase family 3 N-terminal domain-containing protein [Argonema galeatum]MCL1466457.1 glycoside hydrolase family 3 protein [Argonema galeatum A003/A1]
MKIVKLFLAVIILLFAFNFRLPFWASWRVLAFSAIIIFGLGLILSEIRGLSRKYAKKRRVSSFLIFAIASLALSHALALEIKFNLTKSIVLNADANKIEKLGQHFVIGYRNFEEIKTLVYKRAVGGVFITTRNIRNKTKQDIQQEIKALQDIRQSQGLPPLWIATDQEGGMVSRLSPPLTRLPQLSAIVADDKNIDLKKDEIIKYARTQGRELAEIGVNLNFAPVVDLNKGIINPNDKYSKIYQRSISADKEVVAKVALWYCKTLEEYRVRCTIKHFPGLGRVSADTHIADAELPTSVDELTNDDWVPFRQVMSNSQALTMLGHAKLTAVDPKHPVSFSKRVVTDIIRKNWQHNGILITDDFGMQAVYGSKDGFGLATVKAINAGVDLLLISYDKDLYYEAMYALLKASERGNLDREMLEKSRKRLKLLPNSI